MHPLYKKHTMDSAMSSVWEFYKKYFLILYATAFAMSIVLQYFSSLLNIEQLQSTTDFQVLIEKMREMIVPIIGLSLISLFFTTVLQHFVLNKPVDEENNIFKSVIISFKYFVPFLIIMILLTFFGVAAIAIGILLLVVGALFAAVYLLALYLFVLPVMMTEGINIGKILSRIFSLLHRNFWSNIGWSAVFLIMLLVISVIFSAIIMIPFSGNIIGNVLNPGEAAPSYLTSPLFILLSAAVNALTMPLLPIFAAVLYFNAKAGEDSVEEKINEPGEYRPTVEDLYSKPLDENLTEK